MSLETLEVPRHVHKTDGSWKRVENHRELDAAVAEGWLVDPNAGTEPYNPYGATTAAPTPTAEAEPDPVADEESDVTDADLAEVEADELAGISEEPKKRGPGRPRKNG